MWPEQDDLDAAIRGDGFAGPDVQWARSVLAAAILTIVALVAIWFALSPDVLACMGDQSGTCASSIEATP